MKQVGAYEAKTNLSRLLGEVEAGASIAITKHGRPVALLVPAGDGPEMSVEDAKRGLRQFQKEHRLGGIAIRDLIDDGRRR